MVLGRAVCQEPIQILATELPLEVNHEGPFFRRTILWGTGAIATPTALVPPGQVNVAGTANVALPPGERANWGGAVAIGVLNIFEAGAGGGREVPASHSVRRGRRRRRWSEGEGERPGE